MKKGYWFVAYRTVHNEEALKAYAQLSVAAVQSFGGQFLIRQASTIQTQEAGVHQRTVVIEFDSYQTALTAYTSDIYKHALSVLGNAAERDFRIVEGV